MRLSDLSELNPFRPRRPRFSTAQMAALGGAIALVTSPAIRLVASNLRRRLAERSAGTKGDIAVDESLQESFPASDPPASHYYDIPANRQ